MQYRHAARDLNLLLKRDTRAAPKGVIRAPDLDLLLGLDPNGFDESRCTFTLALHEARELGLSHSHWLAPRLRDPIAHFRPTPHRRDLRRQPLNYPHLSP